MRALDLAVIADTLSEYGPIGATVALLGAIGTVVGLLLKDARRNTMGAWTMAKERQGDLDRARAEAKEEADRLIDSTKAAYESRLADLRDQLVAARADIDYWRRQAQGRGET